MGPLYEIIAVDGEYIDTAAPERGPFTRDDIHSGIAGDIDYESMDEVHALDCLDVGQSITVGSLWETTIERVR